MAVKKSSKKKISALFARSRILAFFVAVSSFFRSKAECSLVGKLFTSYNENAVEDSFFCRLFGRLQPGMRVIRPFKRTVSKLTSQSVIISKVKLYLKGWLYTKLNVYGLLFITASVIFLLVQMLKVYVLKIGELSFLDLVTSLLMGMVALILMFSSAPLNVALCKSNAAKKVLFDWLGCKEEIFESKHEETGHSRTALPIGLALGIASWWLRPVELTVMLIVFVFALTVLYIPENGILGIMFLLPFVAFEKLSVLVCYTALCFILKYVRGKRTVRFDPLSFAVLSFALIVRFADKLDRGQLIGFVAFFLAVNLIKSKKWISRCTEAITASFLLTVLYGIARYVSAAFHFGYFDRLFKCEYNSDMVSFFGSSAVFAGYILLTLPLSVIRNDKRKWFGAFISFAGGISCLLLTGEYKALPGFVAGCVLFLVMYNCKSMAALGIMLCVVPFVYVNLNRFIGQVFAERSISDRLAVLVKTGVLQNNDPYELFVVLALFVIFFLCLQKSVTVFSKGCSDNGKLIALGSLSGIVGLAVMMSVGQNTGDSRVNLMFWLVTALCACVGGTERGAVFDEDFHGCGNI